MPCSPGEEPVFQSSLSFFFFSMSAFSEQNNEYSPIFTSDLMCLRRSYNILHLLNIFFDTEHKKFVYELGRHELVGTIYNFPPFSRT